MDGFAVVATHHKTGSVWMCRVFKQIATKLGIPFVKIAPGREPSAAPGIPAIVFSNHSNFRSLPGLLERPKTKIVHLIRDPRDIVISGMHYHRDAREQWLHRPDPDLDGMTYQQKLNSLSDDHSRYLFEMQHNAKRTIKGMRRWNYSLPNAMECKYEDLINDVEMVTFTKMIVHLGFTPDEQNLCRKYFWDRSLFGNAKKIKPGHVKSGSSQQWREAFDRQLAGKFIEEFGDSLIELGYENDNSWIETLSGS